MGTITDKLTKLSGTKATIRAAITDKGQTVTAEDTFASYASKVSEIQTGVSKEVYDLLFSLLQKISTITTIDNAQYGRFTETLVSGNSLFRECRRLKYFSAKLTKLSSGEYMFYSSPELTYFTSSVNALANGDYMFSGCSKIESLSVDFPELKSASEMFARCSSLTVLTASSFAKLETGNHMFRGCVSLTSFGSDLLMLVRALDMFNGCTALPIFSSRTVSLKYGDRMFKNCIGLKTVAMDVGSLIQGSEMFAGCAALTTLTFRGTLNAELDLSVSTKFTQTTLVNILNTLADLTGQASKTLTLGAMNLFKLTAEHKAIATNKNWILA